jgi:uncharacterized SAM-binding protein YcdF (DUF218 family)
MGRLGLVLVSAIVIVGIWRTVSLVAASRQPVDAWLVLGGSIKREMYIAEQAAQAADRMGGESQPPGESTIGSPLQRSAKANIPILISTGSKLPCLWAIFQRAGVNLDRIWVEECANSTFENFVYSVPILVSWNAKHVKLTTSKTHYPRAKWMAQIAFGMRGIWVEFDPAPETGVPGNREAWHKTGLDLTRMVAESILAPILPIRCDRLTHLAQVDWSQWRDQNLKGNSGVSCEHQAQIRPTELPPEIQRLSP